MPGTTRYSATFDRTYEEEDRVDPQPPANTRRSRSLSWQANSGFDGRPYTPLGGRPPNQRSSSTDNGSAKGPEHIPTRTAKTTVKAHNNPFQFVKVGTCPLYKKAEEQLKKAKEVKKPEVLKEEEEEWQTNLDSWKSRRRKMSEDVFRRQEEIKLLELEEQVAQANQKKTKTFSEMVESRATRGRALSLCLISSPLEFQDWEYENKTRKNGSCSFTDESEGNSTVNSEDEGVSIRGRLGKLSQSDSGSIHRTNGDAHIEQNGSKLKTTNGDFKKLSDLSTNSVQMKPKENSYIDSGLESISSSHRAGDTPDSGSDFSPDSNSSIDCDSPRTGVNILEEFTSKTLQMSQGHEIAVKLTVKEKGQDFGFTFLGGKDEGQVLIASLLEGSNAETSGIQLGDRIISINGNDVSCKKHIEIVAMVQKGRENGEISLLLWRNAKSSGSTNGFKAEENHTVKPNKSETQNAKSYEKSVESENEMYVDDFEELQKQSEILAASNKSDKKSTNAQAQTNGNKSPTINKDGISFKITTEVSPAPILKETQSNGSVEEPNKNEQKSNSEANSENQKKNIVKVKRVRRKGVYALNVSSDSNQIPQEGISTNSLFPLSPVTELPSPAEESKTMSSTLSTNNVPASSSQKEAVVQKEAEVKLSPTPVKEASVANTASKAVKAVRPTELKISLSENSASKTESITVLPSPTKTKDKNVSLEKVSGEKSKSSLPSPTKIKDKNVSLENVSGEKPKSTPKKVKVKVKKVAASETTSINSPNIKDGPPSPVTPVSVSTIKESPLVTSATSVKEATSNSVVPVTDLCKSSNKEKPKSSPQNVDKAGKISNEVEKLISPAKGNCDTSTGTKAITSTAEALPLENKVAGITSNNIGNQSPKIVGKNEAAKSSLSTTQCIEQQKNTTITECDKSKPVVVKKVKTKAKQENVASEKTASVLPDSNSPTIEDKTLNVSASKSKVKDLTLNINMSPDSTSMTAISPGTNNKSPKRSPKTPQDEKSKPSFSVKKDKAKSKGTTKEQISPDSLQVATGSSVLVSSTKNASKENQLQKESKLSALDKKEEIVISKIGNPIITPIRVDNTESAGMDTVSSNTELASSGSRALTKPALSDNTKDLTIKIEEKTNFSEMPSSVPDETKNSKAQIKTPQTEKSKPAFAKKKDVANPKVDNTESARMDAVSSNTELASSGPRALTKPALSDKTKDLTIKIEEKTNFSEVPSSVPDDTKNSKAQIKTPQTEKSKPAFAKKKDIANPKENNLEQVSAIILPKAEEPYVTPTSKTLDVTSTNLTKENQSPKESKPTILSQGKKIKVLTKTQNIQPTLTTEKDGQSAESSSVLSDTNCTMVKDKTVDVLPSSNKTRNLKLKFNENPESASVSSISQGITNVSPMTPTKLPFGEKSESAEKKGCTKPKGNATEPAPQIPPLMTQNLPTSASKTVDLSVVNKAKENEYSKEPKSPNLPQGKKKVAPKTENAQPRLTTENIQLPGSTGILPDAKSTCSSNKTADVVPSSSKAKNLKLKIDVNSAESTNISPAAEISCNKPPQTPPKSPRRLKAKSGMDDKKTATKHKGSTPEQVPPVAVVQSVTPASKTVDLSIKNNEKDNQLQVESKSSAVLTQDKKVKTLTKTETIQPIQTRENDVQSASITAVFPDTMSASTKDKTASIPPPSSKTRNLTLKIDPNTQSTNASSAVTNSKSPKTPPKSPRSQKSKPVLVQKKDLAEEKDCLSLATGAITVDTVKNESQASPSSVQSHDIVNNNIVKKTESVNNSVESTPMKNCESLSTMDLKEGLAKPSTGKKPKTRSKKKNTNSQKVNIPAKQTEELKNPNVDSLNIVFQSQPKSSCLENQTNVKNSESSNKVALSTDLVCDVPPVEKVAEEMEKLILEQLEEEERAKELALGLQMKGSPDHLLTAPPKLAEPPKEKPPPPPSANEGNQKETPLKRVNSTKRIKKEIHKRRSNFLGIDNADESISSNEPAIPPPPALEEILKAEMELDRQSRIKIENASTERLTLEEKEIMEREREIIESLESEERQRQLINGTDDMKIYPSDNSNDAVIEHDRIESLIFERKRIETERLLTEEQQQIHILEEKQLREREEFVRKQEANKQAVPLSDHSLSVAAAAANPSKPAISSLTPDTQTNVSLSGANGDGKRLTNSSTETSEIKSAECAEKKAPVKPAVPPKPLKKKEAIRKERERLRQEQEALQREREEHRRKLLEQEELAKHQKSHAPEAPASRLGPLPPLVQPNFPPQLTSTTPNARESASFPSRSHHGAPNMAAGSINAVELMGPPIVRQGMPAPRKAVQKEAWGQQKQMPSVRKQNHDSLPESRYNKNHWLIQEAEMRRITELKERQRSVQLPCSQTHLAEDEVCSNPPRVPVISPPHNPHLNYAVQDKMWNYGQSNMPPKKYPPPVVKESLHTIYPRETISQQPPSKPSRVVPMERQEQMLSVSGRKRCSHCNEELGRGAAMIIESLQLYYHIHCFQCCVCQAQLGNGSCGTDVRVRNNKLHCHNCYSNDEAGLKFSQV